VHLLDVIDLSSGAKQEMQAWLPRFGFLLDDLTRADEDQLLARNLTPAALALTVGISRGFVVAAGIALLALLIAIVTIRVSRQELATAGPEPTGTAPQPVTLEQHEDQAARASAVRPCRLC
jgi:hypothetical protein